jgi:hypothetical protein
VTGPQLQGIFGLPSTPTAVTTVTSAAGAPATQTRRVSVQGQVAAVETGFEVLELNGRVFPARAGSEVGIQRRTHHGWTTVVNVSLSKAGYFDAWLPQPGSYRALYGRVAGPAVRVH